MTDWKTLLDDIADSAPVKYGTLEGRPVVITSSALARGYWLIEGNWVLMNPGDVTQVGLRAKDEFERAFPALARGLAQARAARTASKGTQPAEFIKKLSSNPRFRKAKRSGTAYIIVGAKPPVKEMKTWFITGKLAGKLFARADDGELRVIRPGEQFIGIPFDKLKPGSLVEEKSRGKGEIVDGKKSPRVSRTSATRLTGEAG